METNQNSNCRTAVELYKVAVLEAEKSEKAKNRREPKPNIFLTPNHRESRFYDWDIYREFFNWLKQLNKDSAYYPNQDEIAFLEEIECALILKESGLGNRIPSNDERDWIINILNQRIDIRDSALPPDDYCKIDDRLPLDLVSQDDCKQIYFEIYPEGKKNWTSILMPVSNYYKFTPPSDIKIQTTGGASLPHEDQEGPGAADGELLRNNHLPIDTYGKLAKSIINEFSQAYKVNSDVIAAIVLLIVGSAANRKITLRAWNYINRPCFWLAIVERSGGNKSEPMSRLMKPLAAINKDLVREYNKTYANFASSGSKGTPPARQKIIISDSTPEIRYQLMVTNGLVLVRDELNGFFKDIGRYSSSGEVENLLSTWSGQGFPVDRVNAASFEIENPFLSIIGGIQPKVMAEAFGTKGFAESGFIPRWLFVVPSDSRVPDSVSEKLIDKDLENEWYSLIISLWRMERREFRLSTEAEQAYQGYMKRTSDIMNASDCDDAIRANYAKLRIYCLRFALTIHLLKYGAKAADEVDRKTMDSAIRTVDVFAYWNRQALSLISGSEAKKSISNAELLRLLCERYNVTNQSELARLIGRSQQYVSKVLGTNE